VPTFAERLRERREKVGLTQEQLADKSGVPLSSLRNYEQGNREPYWHVAFRLAAALDTDSRVFADCVPDTEAKPARAKKGKSKGKGR
jgi:transcriptional regulator with XRE-family HTH domain